MTQYVVLILIVSLFPLGVISTSLSSSQNSKLLRVGVMIFVTLLTLRFFRLPHLEQIGIKLIAFTIIFVLAGLWSDNPFEALVRKSMFGISVLIGLNLSKMLSTAADFRLFSRLMASCGLLGALWLIIYGRVGSAASYAGFFSVKGQLQFGDINPNSLAAVAAPILLFSLGVSLIDRSKLWKSVGIVSLLLLGYGLFLTGSRGGLLSVIVGSAVFLVLLGRNRSSSFCWFVVILAIILAIISFIRSDAENQSGYVLFGENEVAEYRLSKTDGLLQDTRSRSWGRALDTYFESPIIGVGWSTTRESAWATVQSAYLQILLESGLLGIVMFLILIMHACRSSFHFYFSNKKGGDFGLYSMLFFGLLILLILHGVFESNLVVGTTPHSILFGFVIGHLDLRLQKETRNRDRRLWRGIGFVREGKKKYEAGPNV